MVATHEVFDPQTGTWSEAAPLPTARDHMVVIAVDGKIHVIGGRFKGPLDRTGLHEVYDPATDKWTSAAPLPTPRSGLASAYYHGLILVLGGELPPDHTFAENEGYDPKTDRWTTLAPMPHGRHGFGGAADRRQRLFRRRHARAGRRRHHRSADHVSSAVSGAAVVTFAPKRLLCTPPRS